MGRGPPSWAQARLLERRSNVPVGGMLGLFPFEQFSLPGDSPAPLLPGQSTSRRHALWERVSSAPAPDFLTRFSLQQNWESRRGPPSAISRTISKQTARRPGPSLSPASSVPPESQIDTGCFHLRKHSRRNNTLFSLCDTRPSDDRMTWKALGYVTLNHLRQQQAFSFLSWRSSRLESDARSWCCSPGMNQPE